MNYPTLSEMREEEERYTEDLESKSPSDIMRILTIQGEHGNATWKTVTEERARAFWKSSPKLLWHYFRMEGEV